MISLSHGGVAYQFVANYYGGTGNDLVLIWKDNCVLAWGDNSHGQLGDNTMSNRSTPGAVAKTGVLAVKTVVSMAAGFRHSLALCSDGTVASWGWNEYGQLGDNTTTDRNTPVAVNTDTGLSALSGKTVIAVAAGYWHSMALCSDGTIAAWGANFYGHLGDLSTTDRLVPVAVNRAEGPSALHDKTVIALAAGGNHSVALCSDGTIATWGFNLFGQLGDNTSSYANPAPVAVNTDSGLSALSGKTVVAVVAGHLPTIALCSDGSLAAWGANFYGQLGDSTMTNRLVPVAVNTVSGVSALFGKTITSMVAGEQHSMVVCSDGTVAAWGYNYFGQLGDNTAAISRLVPVAVNTDSGVSALFGKSVVSVAAGEQYSVALCSDGTMAAWGGNGYGQLGDNTTTNRSAPVAVNTSTLVGGERFNRLSTGGSSFHSLALISAPPVPTVSIPTSASITLNSASLGGDVTSEGGSAITERGAVYAVTSTNNIPRIGGPGVTHVSTNGTIGSFIVNSSSLTPGTSYSFAAYATNSVGTGYSNFSTFTTLNPQESWRQQHFGTTSNSANAADAFDFDSDSIANLMEWAMGLNPTAASLLPVTVVRSGSLIEFTYSRSVAAVTTGAVFSVEWSDTLTNGSWSSAGVSEEILNDNGTMQQVRTSVPVGSAGRRFVHLKVLSPP